MTDFQTVFLEEIEELDGVAITTLIPMFLEKEFNRKIILPINEYDENYNITDEQFVSMVNQIKDLINTASIGLFLYVNNISNIWAESFRLLSPEEEEYYLYNKQYWMKENTKLGIFFRHVQK